MSTRETAGESGGALRNMLESISYAVAGEIKQGRLLTTEEEV